MKPLPTLAAGMLAAFLLLSPALVNASTAPTISVSPSTGVVNGTKLTISGTTTASAGVGLKVTNPSGSTVFVDNVAADSSGAFTDSFAAGGTSNWVTGTYTATATVSSVSASATFSYTATTSPTFNETRALLNIEGNLTQIKAELATMQSDNKGNFTAMSTALTSMSQSLTSLSSQVSTLSTNLGTVQTDVTNMQGQLTTISNNISSLSTAVTAAQTAATAAENAANAANNSVSSTQTYVLVVAVLAAITLVLELAIMIRKLS